MVSTIHNLIELTSNSKLDKALFEEAICLACNHFDKAEHTIFVTEKEKLRLLTTTIGDEDEKAFLKLAIENKFRDCKGFNFVSVEEQRQGVIGMLIIPLNYCGKIIGIWVMEDYQAEIVHISRDDKSLLMLFSFFIGTYLLDQKSKANFYLDALTKVPGRLYFGNMIDALIEKEANIYVCAVKICNMELLNTMFGVQHSDQNLKKLAEAMSKRNIGAVYRIDGSTLALITSEDNITVHDRMADMINDVGKCMDLKTIIFHRKDIEDIFLDLENGFKKCRQGSLLFVEEEKLQQESLFTVKKEEKRPKKHSREEDFDFDLYEILQEAGK